jgi:hypothetical protein
LNPHQSGVGLPIAVAHRGVFMTGGALLPENTVDAIDRGYNGLGYRAFEIDLKNLGDGAGPYIMHDQGPGRTTNADGANGKWWILLNDKVVDGDTGKVLRDTKMSTPLLSTFTSLLYNNTVQSHKVYNSAGSMIGTVSYPGYKDYLGWFLSYSVQQFPDAMFVLDIQTYDVLNMAMQVVNTNDSWWDHVIFKVWATAFPVKSLKGGRIYKRIALF